MNNQEAKSFLETMYSYVDKKMQETNSSVAKVIGATIIEEDGVFKTNSGRYKVKVNAFDDQVLNLLPIGNQTFKKGDNIFIIYWGDLTNAKILCLNN